MKTHAFEHTGQDSPQKWYVPGFNTGYRGGDTDQWGYSGQYYWWGENIGYTYGIMTNSKAALSAGKIGRIGFQERAAFIDTLSYILEVNSPNMAHLQQLLRPDSGPEVGTSRFNSIGIDLEHYEGPYEARDGFGEATLSTHRLGLAHNGQAGGFLNGIVYQDVNGNGWFDAGEGAKATLTVSGPSSFTETVDRLSSHGISSNWVANGTYTVTARAANGTPLGSQTVTINNGNGWFEFAYSPITTLHVAQTRITAPTGTSGVRPTVTWDAVPDAVAYQVWLTNRTTGVTNVFRGATALGNVVEPAEGPDPRSQLPGPGAAAVLRPRRHLGPGR